MKIVIDIPQKLYKELTTATVTHAGEVFAQKLIRYIKNGTPLPKGHGDLIDRKELIEDGINKGFCDWYDEIKYADTIIEADMESEG